MQLSFRLGLVGNRNLPETEKKMLRYLGIQLYVGFAFRWSPLGGRNSKKAREADVIKLPVRQQQWSGGWSKYNTS